MVQAVAVAVAAAAKNSTTLHTLFVFSMRYFFDKDDDFFFWKRDVELEPQQLTDEQRQKQ